MWLLPSRGRSHLVARLFEKGDFKTPGLVLLDRDDSPNYKGMRFPEGWEVVVGPRTCLSEKLNEGFRKKPQEPWYGILNDDHLPITPGWDVALIEKLKSQPMVWPQDNYADRISTPVFDGDLVRTLGWVAPPELKHFYIDDVHELIAECLGCVRLETVMVSHEHVNKGRMPPDRTYLERPNNQHDRAAFFRWCKDTWPQIRQNLGC